MSEQITQIVNIAGVCVLISCISNLLFVARPTTSAARAHPELMSAANESSDEEVRFNNEKYTHDCFQETTDVSKNAVTKKYIPPKVMPMHYGNVVYTLDNLNFTIRW
jgi:hypothetical protein